MTYYFGFEPTEKLKGMIIEAEQMVDSGENTPYYPLRNKVTHQIAYEIMENLLINLISVIPDPERQEKLRGIVVKIEHATDTMLNILLGKDKNEDVIPNFEYMRNETVFEDNEGKMRVGFELDDARAQTILEGFEATTSEGYDKQKLIKSLYAMEHAVIDHFVTRFSETLPLGLIKRKSVPMAKAGINKALEIAINKLLPEMSLESLNRLVEFYSQFLIEKENISEKQAV